LQNGVKTILCIGEDTKSDNSFADIQRQIDRIFLPAVASYSTSEIYNNVILAYEPLWAIGSQIEVDINYVEKQMISLDNYLKSKALDQINILYGGSVNKINIKPLLNLPALAGVLIGEKAVKKSGWKTFLQSMV